MSVKTLVFADRLYNNQYNKTLSLLALFIRYKYSDIRLHTVQVLMKENFAIKHIRILQIYMKFIVGSSARNGLVLTGTQYWDFYTLLSVGTSLISTTDTHPLL